jgi:hypothetical protein
LNVPRCGRICNDEEGKKIEFQNLSIIEEIIRPADADKGINEGGI